VAKDKAEDRSDFYVMLEPLLKEVVSLTEKIKEMDRKVADRPGGLSGNQTPAAGEGSRTSDRSHFRTDVGR
jgi:hypothetical protein